MQFRVNHPRLLHVKKTAGLFAGDLSWRIAYAYRTQRTMACSARRRARIDCVKRPRRRDHALSTSGLQRKHPHAAPCGARPGKDRLQRFCVLGRRSRRRVGSLHRPVLSGQLRSFAARRLHPSRTHAARSGGFGARNRRCVRGAGAGHSAGTGRYGTAGRCERRAAHRSVRATGLGRPGGRVEDYQRQARSHPRLCGCGGGDRLRRHLAAVHPRLLSRPVC